jgi:anti-sigma regulatory factor (Ser/Thr protein kinase)
MGRLRTALAALAPHADGPGRLLSNLDAYATGAGAADFATACCGLLDPGTGVLRYASAGHPPMLVVAPDGTTRWLEDGGSTPLFGRVDPDRPEASVTLTPGSLLVLYSDGLIERRREPLGAGLGRLERAVRDARELPVAALCERVLDELGVAEGRDDDVVLLCLRLAGPGAQRLRTTVPARPEELGTLRAAVRAWSAEHGLGAEQTADLLLALGEACTNAIEHAFVGGSPGTVDVELTLAPDGSGDVGVRVIDSGRWRPEVDSGGLRGRGTGIMRAVTSDFTRRTGADGTCVAFSVPADPERAA